MSRTLFQRIVTTRPPIILVARATTGTAQNTPTREDSRARLATAEAMCAERCMKARGFRSRRWRHGDFAAANNDKAGRRAE